MEINLEQICKDAVLDSIGIGPKRMPSLLSVGKKVLIRTVTMHFVGEIIESTEWYITLKNAVWIQNTGQLDKCLSTGEIFRYKCCVPDEHLVFLGPAVDVMPWNHDLPAFRIDSDD